MRTSCGRLPYLVVAVVALASRCCNALYCHICGAASETEGDPCNLDNVCESDVCFLVKHRGGTWNASCKDPWAASGMPYEYERRDPAHFMYWEMAGNGTYYGACEEDLCNDPKRRPKSIIKQFILPNSETEVTCNMCGYPKTAVDIGNRSISCARDRIATCTGEFCVTVKGDRPRYFCGDAWLLAHIGRKLSDILGCQTLPNGEEHCVCATNDCNKPAAALRPHSRRLYEAVASHIEDFYASASSEEKKFIKTVFQHLQDHMETSET